MSTGMLSTITTIFHMAEFATRDRSTAFNRRMRLAREILHEKTMWVQMTPSLLPCCYLHHLGLMRVKVMRRLNPQASMKNVSNELMKSRRWVCLCVYNEGIVGWWNEFILDQLVIRMLVTIIHSGFTPVVEWCIWYIHSILQRLVEITRVKTWRSLHTRLTQS